MQLCHLCLLKHRKVLIMSDKNGVSDEEFLIEIEKSQETTRIRVSGVSPAKFDMAYRSVVNLMKRAKELDAEIEREQEVEIAKKRLDALWTHEGSSWKLSKSVSEGPHKIALSLLRDYPEFKKQVDVVRETGLPQSTVKVHLNGERKSTRRYFCKRDEGYTLSSEGLRWVLNEVIPSVTQAMSNMPPESE